MGQFVRTEMGDLYWEETFEPSNKSLLELLQERLDTTYKALWWSIERRWGPKSDEWIIERARTNRYWARRLRYLKSRGYFNEDERERYLNRRRRSR